MNRTLVWLASFRLRVLFRFSFLLLALAVLAMALAVLQGEKQRSYDNYQSGFAKTKEQIVARLRHPSGVLALLNPPRGDAPPTPLRPVVLPYSTIDFDDQNKARHAVEMAGCLAQYPRYGSLCVAVGNNPWAGGFIYAAGTFASGPLEAHRIGDEFLDGAHRLRIAAELRGTTYRWIAPFETLPTPAGHRAEGVRGRFTGYPEIDGRDYTGARPLREFRGWVWQEGRCIDATAVDPGCERRSFFSVRLPVDALREALFDAEKPQWPPTDLDRFRVHVQVLPPGGGTPLFDSDAPGAVAPFSLADLGTLLLPGESLSIAKVGAGERDRVRLIGKAQEEEQSSPLVTRLILELPVTSATAPVELTDEIATPLGSYRLEFKGDARTVNRTLSAVVSRVAWFVGAMLLAIALAWVVMEIGIVHRIARLTRRARDLSKPAGPGGPAKTVDLADLRGHDELGILATCLDDLLRRVREDAQRERIRAEQEKDMWHAVGHEIMSPLQSLLALHGGDGDPATRYIRRMQQAVRILYGSASPSEAFESSSLHVQSLDISEFLRNVADNAGIEGLVSDAAAASVAVRADAHSLEDVFSHLLRNAERYRHPGTPITMSLETSPVAAVVTVHNCGPHIPEDLIDKVFEYGVSDQADAAGAGNRGQGLFVAKTYMAKMGGTIAVRNVGDGVTFTLTLQRAAV